MKTLSEHNIEKLASLFPSVITEVHDKDGKLHKAVNFEMLRLILSPDDIADGKEYYSFTWAGKHNAIVEAGRATDKVLRPCIEESKDFETTQNLYIEGENLEVLKIIQTAYMNKIKMIYIDPPYNTGHNFIFNDDYRYDRYEDMRQLEIFDEDGSKNFSLKNYRESTRSNPRFHSDWCSMIYPRLVIARNILSDDGVIFISIDDNEVMNLRKICDEIFGEDNFRNQIVIRRGAKSVQAQFDTWDKLGRDCEYILLYTKNSDYRFPQQLRDIEEAREGTWNNHWRGTDRPTMRYELFGITPLSGQWRWSKERSETAIKNYCRMLQDTKTDSPTQKEIDEWYSNQPDQPDLLRLSPQGKPEHYIPPTTTTLLNSSWMDILIGSSSEINALFHAKIVDIAKLTSPIMRMLKFADKDAIVLDFFSGSATTAHAVMKLNSEDGGHRKFIMVQIQEPCKPQSEAYKAGFTNICEIGKERIRRAGENLKGDTGFRVLKLDSSNMRDVYVSPRECTKFILDDLIGNIKPDRTGIDLLFGEAAESGMLLSLPYKSESISGFTIHTYGDNDIIACFDENINEELIKNIAKRKPQRAVFRDSCFENSAVKINLEQIFRFYAPNAEFKVL